MQLQKVVAQARRRSPRHDNHMQPALACIKGWPAQQSEIISMFWAATVGYEFPCHLTSAVDAGNVQRIAVTRESDAACAVQAAGLRRE